MSNNNKLDILAIVAHPDDAELGCGGTLIKHAELGYKTGIIDLTRGELGTRGTPEKRELEAMEAAKILGLSVRENLGFEDGWFQDNYINQLKVLQKIRQYQPEILITNAVSDRHPDHGRAANLVVNAAFLSGLPKVKTHINKVEQEAWRPKKVLHIIQYQLTEPDIVIDIKGFTHKKMKAILAYDSQFYNPTSTEPSTLIASKNFIDNTQNRGIFFGNYAMIEEAEGFTMSFTPAINNLFDLV